MSTLPPDGGPRTAWMQSTAAMAMVGGAVTAATFLDDFPTFSGQALRYALAALVLAAVAARRSTRIVRPTGRELLWLIASATVGLGGYNIALLHAVRHADTAVVGSIVAAVPLALAIAAPVVSRRRPPLRLLGAAGLVVLGAVLVQGGGRADALGIGLAATALAGEVGFTLFAVPVLDRLGAFSVATHTAWIAAIELVLCAAVVDGADALRVPSAANALALAYLVAASAAAFVLWFLAVPVLGGERAGLAAGVIPIAALLTALPLGRADVDGRVVAGSLVVVAGLVVGVGVPLSRRRPVDDVAVPDAA